MMPEFIRHNYAIHEWKHARAILQGDFPAEWQDLMELLSAFRLKKSWIVNPGGRKSKISDFIDAFLFARGWREKEFQTQVVVDPHTMDSPTHKIGYYLIYEPSAWELALPGVMNSKKFLMH